MRQRHAPADAWHGVVARCRHRRIRNEGKARSKVGASASAAGVQSQAGGEPFEKGRRSDVGMWKKYFSGWK